MTCEIYYFSGTGNSLSVAKDLSERLKADPVPVVSTRSQKNLSTEADSIGLVFPVYDFKAPPLINDLIGKIRDLEKKYIFAICTYGVMPLDTMKELGKVINASGGTLSLGASIKMPHNGIGYDRIPDEKKRAMFEASRVKVQGIAELVRMEKDGIIETGTFKERLRLAGILAKMTPKLIPMMKQVLLHGWDSLGFHHDEKCNGCGTCERICPMGNISVNGGKPVWGDECVGCFACLHWCPEEAIQIANITGKMEKHHHPDISLSDMMKQKVIIDPSE